MKSKNFEIQNCKSKEWNVDAGICMGTLLYSTFVRIIGKIGNKQLIILKTYKYLIPSHEKTQF